MPYGNDTVHFLFRRLVDDEPTYVETYRPAPPAPEYVWVNDNWVWRNRAYLHQDGYWVRPRPNRAYTPGYWQHHPRGHRWVKGKWR
jgi:hypothetical protein